VGLLIWRALFEERTSLSFRIAGPRQRSYSRVRVPWDSRTCFTVSDSNLPFPSASTTRRTTVEIFDLASTRDILVESSRVESSLMSRPTVSRPVCLGIKHLSGAYDQTFITVRQLWVCWCGALSLTRVRVRHLQFADGPRQSSHSWVQVRWDSRSQFTVQIRDFPFRRLLRLAGLRWKYSTPPPHGISSDLFFRGSKSKSNSHCDWRSVSKSWCRYLLLYLIRFCTTYIVSRRTSAMDICEPHRKHRFLYFCIYSALHRNGNYPIVAYVFVIAYCSRLYLATVCLPRTCLSSRCLAVSLYFTVYSSSVIIRFMDSKMMRWECK
jgi:hypothetical protein